MTGILRIVPYLAVLVLSLGSALAESRTVLVLPLDGTTDPGVRARVNTAIEKLARSTSGQVTVGDTTFTETAAAVGCAPADATCAETVRATLGVDELVHGTVTEGPTETTLVVQRTAAGEPARSATAVLDPDGTSELVEAELAPLFGGATAPVEALLVDSPAPPRVNRTRATGALIVAGGGLSVVIGLVLWGNKSAIQDDIDAAPTRSAEDFARLEELEGRASTYAMVGNLMVLGGLAIAGWGSWILYEDHRSRQVTVTPSVTATGAAVTIGGSW